jgi:hypothetical protein
METAMEESGADSRCAGRDLFKMRKAQITDCGLQALDSRLKNLIHPGRVER